MKTLEKFESFKIENASKIFGGIDAGKWMHTKIKLFNINAEDTYWDTNGNELLDQDIEAEVKSWSIANSNSKD
ncbi:hypothetical protein D3C87_679690 [compost metagenome]